MIKMTFHPQKLPIFITYIYKYL